MKWTSPHVWSGLALSVSLCWPVLSLGDPINTGTLPEGFESGRPAYLIDDPVSATPWFIDSSQSKSGSNAIRSGEIGDNETSALRLTGPLPAGTLSFDYLEKTESCCDFMEVRVNGQRFTLPRAAGSEDWQHIEIILPPETETVTFLYRKDDYGSQGADAVWIDNLDFTTTIDTGGNPLDTDGDGLSDDDENLFAALDPYNADDAEEDYDRDRVNNFYEVLSGYSPDVPTAFPHHDVTDYYPLGDITWRYDMPDGGSTTLESVAQDDLARFKLIEGDNHDVLERRSDGIHLLKSSFINSNGHQATSTYDGSLIRLPPDLQMGATVTSNATGTVSTEEEDDYTFTQELEVRVLAEVTFDYRGDAVSGLIISSQSTLTTESGNIYHSGNVQILARDLGASYSFSDQRTLTAMTVRSLDNDTLADDPDTQTVTKSESSGGGGAVPGSVLALLALIALGRLVCRAVNSLTH